jgi:hypothetical protein
MIAKLFWNTLEESMNVDTSLGLLARDWESRAELVRRPRLQRMLGSSNAKHKARGFVHQNAK